MNYVHKNIQIRSYKKYLYRILLTLKFLKHIYIYFFNKIFNLNFHTIIHKRKKNDKYYTRSKHFQNK